MKRLFRYSLVLSLLPLALPVRGDASFSPNVMYYGSRGPLPQKLPLQAGPLDMVYERGDIRQVKNGRREILRMIFVAVRTADWYTLDCDIQNESIEQKEGSFTVTYERVFDSGEMQLRLRCTIVGKRDGTITFSIAGRSHSDLLTNRIGLNVLHPVRECAGQPFTGTDDRGRVIEGRFSQEIAPHGLATDLVSLRWPIDDTCFGILDFQGERFEMEDHRNWTDASYKTYGRPLYLPFPYAVATGEGLSQSVTFRLSEPLERPIQDSRQIRVDLYERGVDLPRIGIGRSSTHDSLLPTEVALVKRVGFSHYRVTLDLASDWGPRWTAIVREAEQLNLPLELSLVCSTAFRSEIDRLIDTLRDRPARLSGIAVFFAGERVTSDHALHTVRARLRREFPALPLGGGTRLLFVELNRDRPDPVHFDFLSYPINPQRHAFDNTTLIENMAGSADTVATARTFGLDKPIHVSDITLKQGLRQVTLNQNPIHLLPDVDARQMSLFGAAWTLGTLKYLAEAGAASLSFYETTGLRGIMQGRSAGMLPGGVPVPPETVFPMYFVFHEIMGLKDAKVISALSNRPLVVDGLCLSHATGQKILLANYTDSPQTTRLGPLNGTLYLRSLDEDSFLLAAQGPEQFYESKPVLVPTVKGSATIRLKPFGMAFIDIEH